MKRKKSVMTKIVEEFELYGKQYRLETGELAKQATGAVLVTCGATSVLVTAVVSSQEKDYDFFPLTVDYIEKMYAVGRIPGGYLKREAKPSDHGTLVARMVDRPIRPGLPGRLQERGAHRGHPVRHRRREPARHHLRGRRLCGAPRGRRALRRPGGLRPHRPRHRDRRVHREPHGLRAGELRSGAHHRRHRRLHLHGRGRRRRDLRGGHAGRHDLRPGGHRRLLREAGCLPRQGEPDAHGLHHPRRRPVRGRARRRASRRDVRGPQGRRQGRTHAEGGRAQVLHHRERLHRGGARCLGLRHQGGPQGPREAGHARHDPRDRRARRRPHPRGDPPAVHRAGIPAPRARLGPVPARPDPGHVRVHLGNAQRVAAPRHHLARRGQALHAPVQLPALLHRRDRTHGCA